MAWYWWVVVLVVVALMIQRAVFPLDRRVHEVEKRLDDIDRLLNVAGHNDLLVRSGRLEARIEELEAVVIEQAQRCNDVKARVDALQPTRARSAR